MHGYRAAFHEPGREKKKPPGGGFGADSVSLLLLELDPGPLRRMPRPGRHYWQASHSGLSMEQNLASSEAPSPAPAAAALVDMPLAVTAFSSPPLPVDFSAELAESV